MKNKFFLLVLLISIIMTAILSGPAAAVEAGNGDRVPDRATKMQSFAKLHNLNDFTGTNLLSIPLADKPIVYKEKEPNNSLTNANNIGSISSGLSKEQMYEVTGTITGSTDDKDYYKFSVPYTGNVFILALWTGYDVAFMGWEDDLYLSLYDSNGVLIAKSTLLSYEFIGYQYFLEQLSEGTYYLGISASVDYGDLYLDEEYSVAIIFDSDEEEYTIFPNIYEETENNDSIENANTVNLRYNEETMLAILGTITDTHKDKDYYRLFIPFDGILNMQACWYGDLFAEGFEDDMQYNILNDKGEIVASSVLLGDDWEAYQVIEELALTSGTYYIEFYQTSEYSELYLDEEYIMDVLYTIDTGVVPADYVTLDKNHITLQVGEQIGLNASVMPENASSKDVFWTSADSSIAAVDENGVVTAVNVGKIYITAKALYGNGAGRCLVEVVEKTESSGSLPSGTVVIGDKAFDLNYYIVSQIRSLKGKV